MALNKNTTYSSYGIEERNMAMKMFFVLAIFLSLFVLSLGQKTHDKQVWKNSASIAISTSAKVTPKGSDRKGISGIPA